MERSVKRTAAEFWAERRRTGGPGQLIPAQAARLADGRRAEFYPTDEYGSTQAWIEQGVDRLHLSKWRDHYAGKWVAVSLSVYGYSHGLGDPRSLERFCPGAWLSTNPGNAPGRMTYYVAPPEMNDALDAAYPFAEER